MWREPAFRKIQRGCQHENVRVGGARQMLQAQLRAQEGAARVDLMHQIETLHFRFERIGEADRARVVDEDVYAAKRLHRASDRVRHLAVVAYVDCEGQRSAARRFNLCRGGIDAAGELWGRLCGLRHYRYVRAVASGTQGDSETDAATRTRNEQGAAFQPGGGRLRHFLQPPWRPFTSGCGVNASIVSSVPRPS